MQRRTLIRLLNKGGWKVKHGGKHGIAVHSSKPGKIPVPHGSQINDYTAKEILKKAGLA